MKNINNEQIADTLTAVSGLSAITHYAVEIQPIISDVAGIAAIVSALFAIRFHYLKSKKYGKNYKNSDGAQP